MNKLAQLLFLLVIPLQTSAQEEERWWDVCNPRDGNFGGGRLPEMANDDEAKVIKALKFAKWKKHDDEFVSFEYPDHPMVKLTVNKAKKPFKVEGGVCSTVDNSYTQAYLLHVGKATYGVFLLRPAEWLDDGVCFCGPMVHHAYKLRDGTLTRFSMLPGGAVKKAQIIGGGLRFMAFEWTHLACQKPIYERMVSSMRLKTADPGGNTALQTKVFAHYGESGKLGLITRGALAASLVKAFGKPVSKTDNGIWTWKWIGFQYPTTLVAKIKEGRLINYPEDGLDRDHNNPVRGSLPWCEKHIKMYPRPGHKNDYFDNNDSDPFAEFDEDDKENKETEKPKPPAPKPTTEDKAFCLTTITKILKVEAGKTSNTWFSAIDVASKALERKMHLPEWSNILIQHGTGQWYETRYLEDSQSPELSTWAKKLLLAEVAIDKKDSKLSSDDLKLLIIAIANNSPSMLNEILPTLWTSKRSGIKRLVFNRTKKLDAITVEKWIFEALALGEKHDRGHLIYCAMEAIPEINIQKKKKLTEAMSKISEGSKNSEWRSIRTKAINSLLEKKPTE